MSGSKRDLSADERELWHRVTQWARPLLESERSGNQPSAVNEVQPQMLTSSSPEYSSANPSTKPQNRATGDWKMSGQAARPGAIDRRIEQRLRRGALALDGRLDLHGLTQRRAHSALHHFLFQAQGKGWRNVLVITGKGGPSSERDHENWNLGHDANQGRGVLNRQVPHWLAGSKFQPLVSGFREAHPRHGGHGALYVRVRRLR